MLMTQPDMDQPPKMLSIVAGEEGDQITVDIPQSSIYGLGEPGRTEAIQAISRFVVALRGAAELRTEDMATIIALDGVLLTLPGEEQPLCVRGLMGSLMMTGSRSDLEKFQAETDGQR